MSKASGGTRTAGPSQNNRTEQALAQIHQQFGSSFNIQSVLGTKMPAGDIKDINKYKARYLNSNDPNDVNVGKFNRMVAADEEVPVRNVPISGLYSAQNYLNDETVAKYMASKEYSTDKDNIPVIVIHVCSTNNYVLLNGNHRVAAAKLNGETLIRAKVLWASERSFKQLHKKK